MQAILEKIGELPVARVRLTLSNDGPNYVHLVKDRLCLRGKLDGDYFTVSDTCAYIGPKRNPAPYSGDELVKLAAGETLSIEIDLADWYELCTGAEVRYKTFHSSIYHRFNIESNAVIF